MTSVLDTESLPKEDAGELENMVQASDFFNLPPVFPSPPRGADYFHYLLMVESGEKIHSIELSDASIPVELRPLIDRMMTAARKSRS